MTQQQSAADTRVYYLDWIRAGAMAAVFLFHCGRAFDSHGWHIKNDETSLGFSIFSNVLVQWMMPTFFLISGWVTFMYLRRTEPRTFVMSRVKRLLLPLIVGTLILVPHQVYIERVTQSGVTDSFFKWLPAYFDGFYGFGGNFAWMGLHLWYLEMLFLFSLILLPILLLFRRPVAGSSLSPVVVFLGCAVLILAVELFVGLFPNSIGRRDFGGWSLLTYVIWFLLGYFIGRDVGLQRALIRTRHMSLAVASTALVLGLVIMFTDVLDFGYAGNLVVRVAVAWGGIAALLGYSARYLNRDAAWRKSINQGILPFYILHQSVIVLVAFFVLPLLLAPMVKFTIIVILSLAATLGIYFFIVQPVAPLRFLLGIPFRSAPRA